ncbi:histidinol-phosphatase HisJ [Shouchella lehensis]|uniref:Histidinol-phosphatase n=1 Tax=Shouchella lehensis G1 TaxID=1246626 RepID=A0A060LZW2_9BACI|nr:histidinol-phosphatase HisJ [Shouchella lehensis]AIC95310.1 histidinol-phosphatase [Shouchella lehensis G1]RQW21121.1 histidinol-phosphatase HisJ [Bacillus sp. C1-1]
MVDGHVHTPYCPHGSADAMASYCEEAIKQGITQLSFTEHAPLPEGFKDPTPAQDSAMRWDDVPAYFATIKQLKSDYAKSLRILAGLEVDYIVGFEKETTAMLNELGPCLEDSILSVHFLQTANGYHCLDYSADGFWSLAEKIGGVDALYRLYYQTVQLSIDASLGSFKPKRIGHMTLCRKYQLRYPASQSFTTEWMRILKEVRAQNLELDYNGAGVIKPDCQETYPPLFMAKKAREMGIPLIYGSDAHTVSGLKSGYDALLPNF